MRSGKVIIENFCVQWIGDPFVCDETSAETEEGVYMGHKLINIGINNRGGGGTKFKFNSQGYLFKDGMKKRGVTPHTFTQVLAKL